MPSFEKWLHKTFDPHSIFSSQHHGSDITLMRKEWRQHKRNGFSSYMFSLFLVLVSVFRTAICVDPVFLHGFMILATGFGFGTGTFVSLRAYLPAWFHDFGYWFLFLGLHLKFFIRPSSYMVSYFGFWFVVLFLGLQYLFLQVSS
jgi:magnesium-transporting ATPase (P-type)